MSTTEKIVASGKEYDDNQEVKRLSLRDYIKEKEKSSLQELYEEKEKLEKSFIGYIAGQFEETIEEKAFSQDIIGMYQEYIDALVDLITEKEKQNMPAIIYKEISDYEELVKLNDNMNRFNDAELNLLLNKDGKAKVVLNYDDIDYEFIFEEVSKFEVDMQYVCYNYIRFVTFEKENGYINISFEGAYIDVVAKNVRLKTIDTDRTKYTYVSVKYRENHEKTFYYISNIKNLKTGDFVWVPVRDEEVPAIVFDIEEFSHDKVPFPINNTRTVIRKSSKYEYERFYGKESGEMNFVKNGYNPQFEDEETLNERCSKLEFIKARKITWSKSEKLDNGSFTMPFPKYEKDIFDWITQYHELKLLDKNYVDNYKYISEKPIEGMSRNEVLTFLTHIIRGEKFCDGLIASNLENGTIEKLQNRLRAVIE